MDSTTASNAQSVSTTIIGSIERKQMSQVPNDFLRTSFMGRFCPFINGGIAGIVATTMIQPIDKVSFASQRLT